MSYDLEWLCEARHGGKVDRCHTVPTIQRYTVAEHTFNVMLVALELCRELDWKWLPSGKVKDPLDIDEDNIVTYILSHDLPEGYTGDIPANVKKETAIKDILDGIEYDWMVRHAPSNILDVAVKEHELAIVKLSDRLELCMFSMDEYDMGNRHYKFIDMAKNALQYSKEILGSMDLNQDYKQKMSTASGIIAETSARVYTGRRS